MEFCPKCKFMVYTRLSKDDTGNSQLNHFCKNCKWENKIEDTDEPIYIRNYKTDYIADKALSNKYTIYDVTLPRVELDCVNKHCATIADIDIDNTLFVDNIPADFTEIQFNDIFKDLKLENPAKRIRLTGALITTSEDQKANIYKLLDNKQVDSNILSVGPYKKPSKEVLYIKYDSTNMRYLYLCAVCGASWKKNN